MRDIAIETSDMLHAARAATVISRSVLAGRQQDSTVGGMLVTFRTQLAPAKPMLCRKCIGLDLAVHPTLVDSSIEPPTLKVSIRRWAGS